MTGDLANYGILQSQSVRLAYDDYVAENPGIPVKLVVEDSAGRSDRGAQVVEKMISVDHIVALVGPVISGVGLAVAPRLQQAQVVTIAGSVSAPEFTKVGDYIFRTQVSDAIQAEVMGRYVFQQLKLAKVAALYTENDYSQPLARRFKEVFEKAGGQVVAMESSLAGDKDFKTQLGKIAQAQPDGLFLPNYAVEIAQILRQAAQVGLKVQMLSADGFSAPDTLALAKQNALGVVYSGPALAEVGVDEKFKRSFVERYKSKYNTEPDGFSHNTYDAAMLLLKAIGKLHRSGQFSRKALRDEIAATNNYQGVSGIVSFDQQGDVSKYQAILTTVPGSDGLPVLQQLGLYQVVEGQLQQVG